MNTTAKAEGMVVAAKTSGSLIIKEMDIENAALPTTSDKSTKVVFSSDAHAFYPSTHDLTASTTTGLKYVSNAQNINFETGTRMNDGVTLTYENVGDGNENYYWDYGVYLAGDGMSMNKALTITIDNAQDLTANGALSIDFYGQAFTTAGVPQISQANFLGTLNLAKKVNTSATASGSKANIITAAVQIGNSDVNKDDYGAYGIIMRVYYDGALIQTAVPDNDYAVYTACTESDTFNSTILYYTDANGSAIYPADSNTDLDGQGLYKVVTASSTTLFARSIKFNEVSQKTINVSFSC
jgi:hypothetical protein